MKEEKMDLSELDMAIARRIKEAREKKGMSQKVLADRICQSRSSVCNMEHGRSGIRSDSIALICEALEVTPNYLFGYDWENNDAVPAGLGFAERRFVREVADCVKRYVMARISRDRKS